MEVEVEVEAGHMMGLVPAVVVAGPDNGSVLNDRSGKMRNSGRLLLTRSTESYESWTQNASSLVLKASTSIDKRIKRIKDRASR